MTKPGANTNPGDQNMPNASPEQTQQIAQNNIAMSTNESYNHNAGCSNNDDNSTFPFANYNTIGAQMLHPMQNQSQFQNLYQTQGNVNGNIYTAMSPRRPDLQDLTMNSNSMSMRSIKSTTFAALPEPWKTIGSTSGQSFGHLPDHWHQGNLSTVNSHGSYLSFLNSQASIGSLLPEWIERSLSFKGDESKRYTALPPEWANFAQINQQAQAQAQAHAAQMHAQASSLLSSQSGETSDAMDTEGATQGDNQRGQKRCKQERAAALLELSGEHHVPESQVKLQRQSTGIFDQENPMQAQNPLGINLTGPGVQAAQFAAYNNFAHNMNGINGNMTNMDFNAINALTNINMLNNLHQMNGFHCNATIQTPSAVNSNNVQSPKSTISKIKHHRASSDANSRIEAEASANASDNSSTNASVQGKSGSATVASGDNNIRWNSWSHEEEVFLVVAVLDRFFRRGSLASATKGSGNTDCWEDIKKFYEKACKGWEALEENKMKPPLISRSTSALCRHFKIMKVRAAEGDAQGTMEGNFRRYLRQWDTIYNLDGRLIKEDF